MLDFSLLGWQSAIQSNFFFKLMKYKRLTEANRRETLRKHYSPLSFFFSFSSVKRNVDWRKSSLNASLWAADVALWHRRPRAGKWKSVSAVELFLSFSKYSFQLFFGSRRGWFVSFDISNTVSLCHKAHNVKPWSVLHPCVKGKYDQIAIHECHMWYGPHFQFSVEIGLQEKFNQDLLRPYVFCLACAIVLLYGSAPSPKDDVNMTCQCGMFVKGKNRTKSGSNISIQDEYLLFIKQKMQFYTNYFTISTCVDFTPL